MFLNQSLFTPGCIRCGSFMVEPSLFCLYCFEKFVRPVVRISDGTRKAGNHIYLIEWNKHDDFILAQLVYRLKAGQAPEAIKFYADLLAEKLFSLMNFGMYEALVPVPGSSTKRVHAELIARRLSETLNLKTELLLEKVSEAGQQKVLSGRERARRNPFRVKSGTIEEFTKNSGSKGPYIFVDDVLTTGQSIKHAETVLAPGKPNAVVTLFFRPSYCS